MMSALPKVGETCERGPGLDRKLQSDVNLKVFGVPGVGWMSDGEYRGPLPPSHPSLSSLKE